MIPQPGTAPSPERPTSCHAPHRHRRDREGSPALPPPPHRNDRSPFLAASPVAQAALQVENLGRGISPAALNRASTKKIVTKKWLQPSQSPPVLPRDPYRESILPQFI